MTNNKVIVAVENTQKITKRTRATKLSALEMLEHKFDKKTELKRIELDIRRKELELQEIKMDREHEDRKKRMEMEFSERKAFLELIQNLSKK